MKRLIPLTLLAATIAGCATSPTGRSQLMIVSPDSAIVESQKAYASTVTELDSNQQLITDPAWVKRISTITGRLITEAIKQHPDTADWKWSVAIIDDPDTLNAWCMAGGRMAIYSGIVTQLDLTDDEIARRVVGAASISSQDTVVEIGPGRGALTGHLVACTGDLHLVEIDRELVARLEARFGTSVQVYPEDVPTLSRLRSCR
mgnify:CR=1 FL=1